MRDLGNSPSGPLLPKSGCGLAELLCALALAGQHGVSARGLVQAAGYPVPDEAATADPVVGSEANERAAPTGPSTGSVSPGPLSAPVGDSAPDVRPTARMWAVTRRETMASADSAAADGAGLGKVSLSELQAPPGTSPEWHSIVPLSRLMPALKRNLRSQRRGALDVAQLVQSLARAQVLRRLPRRALSGWAERLLLVLDMHGPLAPYRRDMLWLACHLQRWLGPANVAVRLVQDSRYPPGIWRSWSCGERAGPEAVPPWRADWDGAASSGRVLLISALGLMADDGGEMRRGWGQWLHGLQRQGTQVQVWCPLPLGEPDFPPALPRLPLVHWSAASTLRAQPLPACERHNTPERQALAAQLCTRLATVARVSPGLLRALRRDLGATATDAGLEQLVWDHPDLSHYDQARALLPEARDRWQEKFDALHSSEKIAVLDVILKYQHAYNPLLAHMETLVWASHVAEPERQAQAGAIAGARQIMQRLAQHPQIDGVEPVAFYHDLKRWVEQADAATREYCQENLQQMWHALHRDESGQQPLWLGWNPKARTLCLCVEKPPAQFLLAQTPVNAAGLRLASGDTVRWLVAQPGQDVALARLPWGGAVGDADEALPLADGMLQLYAGQERITLAELERPALPTLPSDTPRPPWALEWGRDRAGSYALVPNPWGPPVRVAYPRTGDALLRAGGPAPAATPAPKGKRKRAVARKPNFSISELTLALDEIGPFATLTVQAANGQHSQTFRYIAPGQFTMGSPEDEPERFDDEGPQHPVTITEGFWLADTACTQGFWQAVMGENPSYFNESEGGGPQHPVEQVSWNMIQPFLQKLQSLLPDCYVSLPTEAEWEYACRAGTSTPFWFGNNISTDEVNYDGNYPYNGGEPGAYRRRTVAVKDLPRNAWGLYQMHGNVWEWCGDKFRTYEVGEVQDPGLDEVRQPTLDKESVRALRGGGWIGVAQDVRSACRNHFMPDWQYRYAGFRLALRSSGLASRF